MIFNLPLDIVFKLITVTPDVPFMKYNPGVGKEKIFKLYADQTSKTKKRIPLLSKSKIFALHKDYARSKSVAIYIVESEKNIPIICEFYNNGSISFDIEFDEPESVEFINTNIKNSINPIISKISDFLQQSGYDLDLLENIYDENIEIINLKFVMYLSIKRNIYFKRLTGCVSSLCNIINDDIKEGTILRFKRVTNYNEMDSINSLITELLMQRKPESEVINHWK